MSEGAQRRTGCSIVNVDPEKRESSEAHMIGTGLAQALYSAELPNASGEYVGSKASVQNATGWPSWNTFSNSAEASFAQVCVHIYL